MRLIDLKDITHSHVHMFVFVSIPHLGSTLKGILDDESGKHVTQSTVGPQIVSLYDTRAIQREVLTSPCFTPFGTKARSGVCSHF